LITLRRLTVDDYDAIIALWQRAGLHSLRSQGRDSREAFAAQLARGQVVLGLNDAETGKLVACVVITDDARKGWINRLAVDPDYRRQGLAARLMAEAENDLRARGFHVFAALIEDDNAASLSLFQREGYKTHDIVYVSKRDGEGV
jgi:ribosomal protein S18 acetylase RimI-like enzyme